MYFNPLLDVSNDTYSVSQSQTINFTRTQQQPQNQGPSIQNPQNRSHMTNAGNLNVMNPNLNMPMNIPSQNPGKFRSYLDYNHSYYLHI